MSNEFSTYKIYAQLAQDAYEYKKTSDIFQFGNQKYEVLIQRNLVGFQATLYRDTITNEKILAIRGTDFEFSINGADDLLNDVLLGTLGDNWQTNDLQKFYNDMVETGILSPNDKLTVTGHSLGGYLAQFFTLANPEVVNHAYTYNAPGLFGSKGTILNILGISNFNSDKITDIVAKDWLNAINGTGINIGKRVEVSGDDHSIVDLTQILYFYDMAISNGASQNEVTSYLSGFYNTPNSILYGFLNGGVANIAKKTAQGIEQIIDKANGSSDIIEICNAYENNNVKFNLDLISPTSSVTSFFSGSNLSTPALYALVNLNPFIISGINSNAYSELEKYKNEYSENYIKDKASMFSVILGQGGGNGMYYKDYESGKAIVNSNIQPYDDNTTNPIIDETIMFGTNSNDTITNSFGDNNKFYTLAGDDRITLSSGSNYKFINLNLLVA